MGLFIFPLKFWWQCIRTSVLLFPIPRYMPHIRQYNLVCGFMDQYHLMLLLSALKLMFLLGIIPLWPSQKGGRKGSRHFEFWKILQMFVYGFEEEQFSDPVDVHTYKQQI